MSVRPNLIAIIGVDDLTTKDHRCNVRMRNQNIEKDVPPMIRDDFAVPGNFIIGNTTMIENIFEGNPMGISLKNIVGAIVSESPEDVARFWMTVQHNNGNGNGGYVVLKTREMSQWEQEQYYKRELIHHTDRYEYETPWYREIYEQQALHLLHYAGYTGITQDMLKWMLVWYWA